MCLIQINPTSLLFDDHINMALRSTEQWTSFLEEAGIPAEFATTYATKFFENRITELALPELTKETLRDLGITVLGDILAIIRQIKTYQPSSTTTSIDSQQPSTQSVRTILSKPPTATSDMTNPQFRKFIIDWGVYKTIGNIPHNQITIQLYNLCDEVVQKQYH